MNSQPRANIPVHYPADAYDRYTQAFLGRFDRLLADRLLQEFRANPSGRRLLDAGCGTCQFLRRLAGHAELSAMRFIGLDYYPDMIQISRGNVRDGIVLVQGDIHYLPFPPGAIDFVISRSTLHHWADPVAALLEIRRVLAPHGVALIHEIRRDPDPAALAMFNRLRAEAGVEPSRLEEKYTLDEIHEFVARSGLAGEAAIFAPSRGYSSLGCEVRIAAPG